jgi:hypothetical protein
LIDTPESLEIRVLNNVEHQSAGDMDKPINRVVDNF